jgi:hypothetical protein
VHVDGPNPRVVEGGPGGQGGANLAALALALVALAGCAATTTPVVIASMTETHPLTLAAIAGGMRLIRGRRSWGIVGVEYLWGRCRCLGTEHDLL